MRRHKGFTLIEMAIVLIVMGIIVGGSAKLFTTYAKQSKKMQTSQTIEKTLYTIEGFVRTFGHLPTVTEYQKLSVDLKDSWGKELYFFVSKDLREGLSLCSAQRSVLKQKKGTKEASDIAFILLSSGANRNLQTRLQNDWIETAEYGSVVDLNSADFSREEPYDDLFTAVSLYELKAKLGCKKVNHAQ